MSEKKEFKPLDVGATERVDWEVAQGLSKYVRFDKNGNVTFGKSVTADGTIGGNNGLEVMHTYTWSSTIGGYQWDFTLEVLYETVERGLGYTLFNGYLRCYIGDVNIAQDYAIIGEYEALNGKINQLNGITFGGYPTQSIVDGTNLQLFSYTSSTQTVIFTNYALASKTQPKQFTHTLTLTADKSYTLMYQSASNLKVDSVADLRKIMNVKATSDNVILTVGATDLSAAAVLQVTTALCKIGAANVTTVADNVTL